MGNNRSRTRNKSRSPAVRDQPLLVSWQGQTYRIADKIGAMPLLRFAKVAETGVGVDDMVGLAATYDLLEQCLTPDDWRRFIQHATTSRASADEILDLMKSTYAVMSGRPPVQPSVSSDGPTLTAENFEADSSSPVMRVLDSIPDSRPDLKLAVWNSAQQTG
jgi:hypothetical protein